jgi:hypothetical protein
MPAQSYNKAALVGFASKGPINTPTTVHDTRQLWTMFGFPHPDQGDSNMLYAAEQYLMVGTEVTIYRAADPQLAKSACIPIPVATNLVKTLSTVKGPYVFERNQFFRWRVDGVLSPKTLVVLATEQEGISAAQLAEELNEQLTTRDGIRFFHQNDYLGVQTTFPDKKELELVSVQDAMYGPWSAIGLGVEMAPAEKIGQASKEVYDFQYQENMTLDIVISGSNNVTVDGIVQTIKLKGLEGRKNTINDIVDYVNNIELPLLPGGWRAFAAGNSLGFRTKHAGRDASILVKSGYVATSIFGFDPVVVHGKSPRNAAIFFGSTSQSDEISFTIYADSPGVEGNSTRVIVVNEPDSDTFTINVYSSGVLVESWGQLTKDKTNKFYVEAFINLVSEWIRVQDNPNTSAPPKNGAYLLGDEKVAGAKKGCDGVPSDLDSQEQLLAGDPKKKSGMFSMADPEEYSIDMIAVPGRSSKTILDALLAVCEMRKDCLAIIDPPMELSVRETMAWIKPYQSDCAALFWPWVQIRDSHNRRNVWVPPSGSIMAAIARSDALSSPWISPTGIAKGIIPGVVDVFNRPTREESKLLNGNNHINPILHNEASDSFTLSSYKTLSGEDISVKRLLFYVEKNVRRAIDTLLSGNLTEGEFREKFEQVCEYVLGQMKNGRGIYKYTIQAEGLNTPEEMKELRTRIGVQPREASESYYINFAFQKVDDNSENDTFFIKGDR